ncbi:MAG: hypothetical protein U1C46_12160 [Bacteroidales bacterium]|nr:hypothetical protein [Bacteroidales bacterium]MDZ4205554.1 hypothetical protein [Bacteroidales bacterium]
MKQWYEKLFENYGAKYDAESFTTGTQGECDFIEKETDEMNFQILQSASNALKENGKLIFTTLNGLFPLFHSVKDFLASSTKEGNATYSDNTFDLVTFRDFNVTTVEDDDGNMKELQCNERYYVPSEITWLLKSLNFKKIDIYGAKLGAFSRYDTLTTEDFEMLVIAEK